MALVTEKTGLHADRFTGKFGEPDGYGHAIFARSRYGLNMIQAGVYQYQNGKKGKVLSRHRDNWPTKSNSEGALRRREMFRNGMLAWKALDIERQQEYNKRRYPAQMNGCNRFLKIYLKNNH